MNEADIDLCIETNVADMFGFVTEYPLDVPWNLSRKRAAELIKYVRESKKNNIECVIVTGGKIEKLISMLNSIKPDYIQLHYNENSETIKQLQNSKTKIIKTVPINPEERFNQSGEYSIDKCSKKFERAGADILLVDSRQPSNAAEKSKFLDEKFFNQVKNSVQIPTMAAGGINPENFKYISETLKPDYIDIMTGVEISPGHKSKTLLEKLKSEKENLKTS